MSVISGVDGKVTYSCGDTYIKSWTLNTKADLYDSTNFDSPSGYREYVAGFTDWNGSYEGFYPSSGGNTVVPGSTGTILLQTSISTGTGIFTGDVIIIGMDIGVGVDGLITQSYTFQGTGVLGTT